MLKIQRQTDFLNYKNEQYKVINIAKNDIYADALIIATAIDGNPEKTIIIPIFKKHLFQNLDNFENVFNHSFLKKESTCFKNGNQNFKEITIPCQNPKCLADYLKSLFINSLNITAENCSEYYHYAKYFEDKLLILQIENFIKNNLTDDNIFQIIKYDEFNESVKQFLISNSKNCILKNLKKISSLSRNVIIKLVKLLMDEKIYEISLKVLMLWISEHDLSDAEIMEMIYKLNFSPTMHLNYKMVTISFLSKKLKHANTLNLNDHIFGSKFKITDFIGQIDETKVTQDLMTSNKNFKNILSKQTEKIGQLETKITNLDNELAIKDKNLCEIREEFNQCENAKDEYKEIVETLTSEKEALALSKKQLTLDFEKSKKLYETTISDFVQVPQKEYKVLEHSKSNFDKLRKIAKEHRDTNQTLTNTLDSFKEAISQFFYTIKFKTSLKLEFKSCSNSDQEFKDNLIELENWITEKIHIIEEYNNMENSSYRTSCPRTPRDSVSEDSWQSEDSIINIKHLKQDYEKIKKLYETAILSLEDAKDKLLRIEANNAERDRNYVQVSQKEYNTLEHAKCNFDKLRRIAKEHRDTNQSLTKSMESFQEAITQFFDIIKFKPSSKSCNIDEKIKDNLIELETWITDKIQIIEDYNKEKLSVSEKYLKKEYKLFQKEQMMSKSLKSIKEQKKELNEKVLSLEQKLEKYETDPVLSFCEENASLDRKEKLSRLMANYRKLKSLHAEKRKERNTDKSKEKAGTIAPNHDTRTLLVVSKSKSKPIEDINKSIPIGNKRPRCVVQNSMMESQTSNRQVISRITSQLRGENTEHHKFKYTLNTNQERKVFLTEKPTPFKTRKSKRLLLKSLRKSSVLKTSQTKFKEASLKIKSDGKLIKALFKEAENKLNFEDFEKDIKRTREKLAKRQEDIKRLEAEIQRDESDNESSISSKSITAI